MGYGFQLSFSHSFICCPLDVFGFLTFYLLAKTIEIDTNDRASRRTNRQQLRDKIYYNHSR
jgi:hypothetical protein